MKSIIKAIPFTVLIVLSIFAQIGGYNIGAFKLYAVIIGAVLIINMMLAVLLKVKDYFLFGTTSVAILGILSVLFVPLLGEVYIRNITTGLYIGLFIVAFFPPIFKMNPFTYQFSENNYPKIITQSKQFFKINLIINYIWAVLFAMAIVLTKVTYSDNNIVQTILAITVPLAPQLIIGIPATKKLPVILMQTVKGARLHFSSIKELFEAMPLGLNKKRSAGVDALIQFMLTGKEPANGYMEIKNQKCTYTDGIHKNPKTIIKCDSELWLKISNNEVSGDLAFMKKEYEVQGDMSVLLDLNRLFSNEKEEAKTIKNNESEEKFEYKKFGPDKIKNIVVFDGGPRSDKLSKTTFMVKHFCEGAKQADANVEYIRLKDKEIKPCTGCFMCWTKTPGECVHKDDMTDLRKKYREADLVVFASPLYIFSVTGIFKNFMDRMLPIVKPYMLLSEQGFTMHPDRFPELGEQGFVVFSAAGFPDIEHNYDGISSMFRLLDKHSENIHMMGEFYLPAAETIVQPFYKSRKDEIKEACHNAGVQIVKEGKVDKKYMRIISDTGFSKETFKDQANNFWESLEDKKSFLTEIPKL